MALSIGAAVGAAFNLITRRPLSVVIWGLFSNIAVVGLFALGVVIVGLPALTRLLAGPQTFDPAGQAVLLGQTMLALWPALLLVLIGGLFVGAMTQGAAIRSILRPGQRAFASLRFGREELALVLLALALFLVAIVVYLISALALALIFLIGRLVGGGGGALAVFLLCVAYGLALMWVLARFSLAAPMTFAEGRVRFFGSWGLTRGEGWSAFGLAWVMALAWIGVAIAFYVVALIVTLIFAGAALAGAMVSLGGPGRPPSPAAFAAAWPLMLLAYVPMLLIGAAFTGVAQALAIGPWANAYMQLRGSPDVAATFS